MAKPQPTIIAKPDSASDVSTYAEQTLQRAGTLGVLPTPIDTLITASRLTASVDPEPLVKTFLSRLKGQAKEAFATGWQKLRGIADLRERAIYVPSDKIPVRVTWAKAHELGHQMIPWHTVNSGYQDDERSLSADAQELFDQEANFFASEVIFQGRRFQRIARDYQPSLDAVLKLADQHGASRQSTLWRFVEDHDEPLAGILYWPSRTCTTKMANRRSRAAGSSLHLRLSARNTRTFRYRTCSLVRMSGRRLGRAGVSLSATWR